MCELNDSELDLVSGGGLKDVVWIADAIADFFQGFMEGIKDARK